jgi:hypothetical protein
MPKRPLLVDELLGAGRFTIDVPLSLHMRVKVACAERGLKMADVLRDLLERDFPANIGRRLGGHR